MRALCTLCARCPAFMPARHRCLSLQCQNFTLCCHFLSDVCSALHMYVDCNLYNLALSLRRSLQSLVLSKLTAVA